MHRLLESLDEREKHAMKKAEQPPWIPPMLATLTDRRFSSPDWLFERKFDGERCLVLSRDGDILLSSRNMNRLNDTYPEIEAAFRTQGTPDFIADGEIVAFEGEKTSFALLQNRMQIADRAKAERSRTSVCLYLFDLMHLDGYDITPVPLRSRKAVLRELFVYADPLRYSTHHDEQGEACFDEACRRGWEGVIAKRSAGRYVPRRSPDWLKFKCLLRQEFVIGGFTDPLGSRAGFGALLIGYYEKGSLVFAGKVGTGFDDRLLDALAKELASLEVPDSPFGVKTRAGKGEHFVRPVLVCEVAFTEWTDAGVLRHPRFMGLRNDKPAGEVARERPR